jgi:hypothetical protein
MKLFACLLLLAGWAIALAAVALLRADMRSLFVYAGIGVEGLGVALLVRAHQAPHGESE